MAREGKAFLAVICDAIRAVKPPFDPGAVTTEFAGLAKQYGIGKIVGDAYSGEWVSSAFRDTGLTYETSPLPKSGLFIEALPHWNQGAISIPDHPALVRELMLLERRTHRSGRDSVDHPRGGSDDLANSLVGCLHLAVRASRRPKARVGYGSGYGPIRWEELEPAERTRDRISLVTVREPKVRW